VGFFDPRPRRAVAGMFHFPRCDAKKDSGVRTLVLSVFGTSRRPETQIKGIVRKNAGVLKIICGSGNVSSEMERKARRRIFRDSTVMGELGALPKKITSADLVDANSRIQTSETSGKAPSVPFQCH
jgi:hypothetical protein